MLQEERLDDTVLPPARAQRAAGGHDAIGRNFVDRVVKPKKRVKIAVVGKYIELQDAYKSIYESHHARRRRGGLRRADLVEVDAEELEQADAPKTLGDVAGILVPGGFGDRGVEGKIRAAQFARENGRALPRPLPRHADRDDRICPQRLRARPRRTARSLTPKTRRSR